MINSICSIHVYVKLIYELLYLQKQVCFIENEPQFAISVSRESLVLLELPVVLDTKDLVACPVSAELLEPLEVKERR